MAAIESKGNRESYNNDPMKPLLADPTRSLVEMVNPEIERLHEFEPL